MKKAFSLIKVAHLGRAIGSFSLRLGLITGLTLLLAGCFGGNDPSPTENSKIEGFHSYATEEFKIQIPDEWEVLTPLNFTANMPENTVVAFRNNIRNPRFTPNVVIVRNNLSADIAAGDYARTLRQKISNELSSFREIATQTLNINVAGKQSETLYLHAEGRQAPDSDLKRFIEIAAVKGRVAYIAIGSFLANAPDTEAVANKMETMIKSFEIK